MKLKMSMFKIVTFVPIQDANRIRQVMGDAGAGVLGNYHHASFSTKGVGRFIPAEGAHPVVGKKGEMSQVKEERIEVICQKKQVKEVISAIKKYHPYEEIPIEVYELVDLNEI